MEEPMTGILTALSVFSAIVFSALLVVALVETPTSGDDDRHRRN
jgi:hypothetical protein